MAASTAKPVLALATTETVAAQKAAKIIVVTPSSRVPTMYPENMGLKCNKTTIPVMANEKAEQKTDQRALVLEFPCAFF